MARSPKEGQPEPQSRRGRAQAVRGDAECVAAAAFTRAGFSNPSLVLRWREVAGADVARLAQPVKLTDGPSGGTLTLRAVPGAALFLAHEKRALAERINAYLGRPAVAQIKFSQGTFLPPARGPEPQKAVHPLPPGDPSSRYQGPEGIARALQALARRR